MLTRSTRQFLTSAKVVFVLAALAALMTGASPSGEVSAAKDACSLKTLRGTYLFVGHGTMKDGQSALPYAEAGTWTLDGAGRAQGVFSAGLNGATIANLESFSATYQHKSGCVFIGLAPVGNDVLEFHLYTTDRGATIAYFMAGISGVMYRR